jgi:salicylate 5-hydroxylase large subunit
LAQQRHSRSGSGDERRRREELARPFCRGDWQYSGPDWEIPKPGDFRRTKPGERSVILVRGADGTCQQRRNKLKC